MWHIFKAEIIYNRYRLWWMFTLIPVFCAFQLLEPELPGYLVLLFMFAALKRWNNSKKKEKREFQQIRLPISLKQVAIGRILIVGLIGFTMAMLYQNINRIIFSEPLPYQGNSIVYLGLIMIVFSIYYILRDLLFDFAGKLGLTGEKMRILIISVFLALNVAGIYFFIIGSANGESLRPLKSIVQFLLKPDPFDNTYGIIIFIFLSILPAFLTVFTFGYRKSFLE